MHQVTVHNLTLGAHHILLRYKGTETLPVDGTHTGYEFKTPFIATGSTQIIKDPHPIISSTAVYYIAY